MLVKSAVNFWKIYPKDLTLDEFAVLSGQGVHGAIACRGELAEAVTTVF